MFVKNLVDVALSTLSINITVNETQVYSGNVKSVPAYLLNERVKELGIFGTNFTVKI